MSFSKAKIQRFNEIKASVHGTNKQFSEKPKSKQKTGIPLQCEKSSEKATSDTASSQSVPCFRTPTLLKKKLKSTVNSTISAEKVTTLNTADQHLEALKEKIVEIENKDAYIKDLIQQLDDFKERINKIEHEKQNVENEKHRYEKLIEDLKTDHELNTQIIQTDFQNKWLKALSLKEKMSKQLHCLKEDFQRFQTFYMTDVEDLKNHCSELPVYFKKYADQYQSLFDQKQAELQQQEKFLSMVEQNSIEMQKQHSLEIEKLRKEQQLEVQDLEFEMLRTMTDLQREKEMSDIKIKQMEDAMNSKILTMREIFENDKKEIYCQSEMKIKELEDSLQKCKYSHEPDVEEKFCKLENEWKNKLLEHEKRSEVILKECQAISEYNIIQCTVEKNAITADLKENENELKTVKVSYEELTNNFNELKTKYKQLKIELNSKKLELEDVQNGVITELDHYHKELKQTLKEKSAYEFTIRNSQVTIMVLTKRLIHSDKDVEQLKEELSVCEKKLLDYEDKNIQLTEELKQAQLFAEELEMQFESTIKINCKDIDNMGVKLLKDVNDYKKEVTLCRKQFKDEQCLKQEIMQQLHDAYDMINRLKMEFENAETVCSQYKFEIQQSQNELEDYHMREMDWNIIKDKLESTIKELEQMLESRTYEIIDLNQNINLLEQKTNSISQFSDYYKQKVKELEQDQLDTGKIHKKYVELSGKYDYLSCKYEELETENLQNKLKIKASEEQIGSDLKQKDDEQVTICNDLQQNKDNLEQEIQHRLGEETRLQSDYMEIKTERDTLLIRVQQLEKELLQNNLDTKQHTTKKCKKIKDRGEDPKKWVQKNKHSKNDKENVSSPNRTLNSNRIDSPLRDRN